ncbi:DUF5677 domain-containing protein [Silvimonas amylolytica]|uniref:Abortive infection protein, AbiV family n=1 Tax=Silvimonas amylolytica TaxID=449663 RepID=A0ABQ2PP27_9NEIS|nr:DUF5677 domain-containing protein [Silvimonas amylolytica]GGP27364.1 hypothetical protein GCM10010971_31830 [Silvimonas amylolytica]
MPTATQTVLSANRVKTAIDEALKGVIAHENDLAKVGSSLFLTIAELYRASLVLFVGNSGKFIPNMVRPMLEAWGHLRILRNDPAYLERLQFKDALDNVKMLTAISANPDNYPDWLGPEEANLAISQLKALVEHFEQNGTKHLGNTRQTLKDSGVEETYLAFQVLCSYTHNQLSAVLARHEYGKELHCYAPTSDEMVTGLLEIATTILKDSFESLPIFTNLTSQRVREVHQQMDDIWVELHS